MICVFSYIFLLYCNGVCVMTLTLPLNVLSFGSVSSITCVTRTPSLKLFSTNLDCFLLHSTHLFSINLVSVYDNPWVVYASRSLFHLNLFLYIFNDSKTCNNERSEFEIKDSMSSQIFETLVALAWDNFTVPLLS